MPNILYTCIDGRNARNIVERHLKRLEEENWDITLALPDHLFKESEILSSWRAISLPTRKWWWPPVRTHIPGSLNLRISLWQAHCQRSLGSKMPNSIITILGNYYSLLASSLSKRWGIPLSVFVHDDWTRGAKSLKELEVSNQQVRKVLQQATQIWAVTPELAEKCKSFTSSKARVSTLLPIPEETAAAYIYHSWNKSYKNPPTIAHAGTVESFHIPYFMLILKSLSNFGGKLIIISSVETNPHIKRFQEECKLQGFNNIEIVDFFHTVHEAKLYLQEKASCLLVVYPLEPQLEYFLATSFPSRLVEFSHLGLPLMIIASQKSSLGKWAKQNLLSSYFSQADFEEINIFVKNLMNEGEWRILAEETQRIARSRFNPGEIHSQFLSELARN